MYVRARKIQQFLFGYQAIFGLIVKKEKEKQKKRDKCTKYI